MDKYNLVSSPNVYNLSAGGNLYGGKHFPGHYLICSLEQHSKEIREVPSSLWVVGGEERIGF